MRAAGRVARFALDEPVDGHLGHPPPGRELAAGDRDHARRGLIQLGLARDVDRLLRVAGRDQRPHAGERAGQLARLELGAEEGVDGLEQIVDVLARRLRRARGRPRSRCRSCRSACARATAARRSSAPRRPARSRRRPAAGPRGADVMWVPRLGRMRGSSASSCSSCGRRRSAHTPVALTTLAAAPRIARRLGVARAHAARRGRRCSSSRSPRRRLAQTAPKRSASPSTVSTRRTSSVWQS